MNSTHIDQSIYQPLDVSISEIRVLTLHRGSRDEELRCTLKTLSLDDEPEFHALSYVWGLGTEKDHIDIHGHVTSVTSNLATALREIRDHHYDFFQLHSIPLWIDAICINQADIEERAQQVVLMRRVYRQASRVLVWIGEGDESSDHAFDRIDDATFRASCGELKTTPREPTLDEIRVTVIMKRNLENRRYWTRTWTLQEVALAAQDPIILCGSRRIVWSRYTQCKRDLPDYHGHSCSSLAPAWASAESEVPFHRDWDDSFTTFSDCHEGVRYAYQKWGPIELEWLLTETAHLAATDPRDSIYAVLGLVLQDQLHLVEIDYGKTPERVFEDTMYAVWTSRETNVIGHIIPQFNFGLANKKSDVPSWVPDFLRKAKGEGWHAVYLVDRRPSWRCEMPAEIHIEDRILTVKAFKFDSITYTLDLGSYEGRRNSFHRGKAAKEVDIEPLQNAELMAERGCRIPIPASSCLAPFSVLRDRTAIWSLLTTWSEGDDQDIEDKWLPEVPKDKQKLWEILLGRQKIPEAWNMACSPELRNNQPALEAAILSPMLEALRRKAGGKKAFISRYGFVGLATPHVEAGDIVIFIVGMTCMYVLRPFQDGYHMVGFANVSGLMNWDDLDEAMKAGTLHEEELKIY